jgi:transcriptional regulator with XRE-family HTH domain
MTAGEIGHWTQRSADDLRHKLAADFVLFIERSMGEDCSQSDLAKRLNVTEGRVSQVLNNPESLSLKNVVLYARAVGACVSLVAYKDNDDSPISGDIFAKCWERLGKPRDLFDIQESRYLIGTAATGTTGVDFDAFSFWLPTGPTLLFINPSTEGAAYLAIRLIGDAVTPSPELAESVSQYEPSTIDAIQLQNFDRTMTQWQK